MDADGQVSQLEQALLKQAATLAAEHLRSAEAARARILSESRETLRRAEAAEVLAAKVEAERRLRRDVQAAETRLAAELDRTRWALTQATLAQLDAAWRALVEDDGRHLAVLEAWLAAAARDLPAGDLVAEVRPEDERRLAPQWQAIAGRAAPGRAVALVAHGQPSAGGVRVRLVDGSARLDQTVEARRERLADELARVVMERLFASAPDLGTLVHG